MTTPKIRLIGRLQVDIAEIAAFLKDQNLEWRRTPGATIPEELVEVAGRICYMSFGSAQSPRTNRDFIMNLITQGHESVLEHASWTFLITNISRAFTHQLVRHRVGFAFSQLSQQYHDERDAEFVMPAHLESFPEAKEAWEKAIRTTLQAYSSINALLSQNGGPMSEDLEKRELTRAIRSAARSVLPNATETKIVMSANARALRHFFQVRGTIPGDIEMRLVAAELLSIVANEAPSIFLDFRIDHLLDGSPIIRRHRST
ncbi:FAD-dependent thymidylate synthase [Acidobacteria bacterium AB60]|nr:FAD-dependent thymidylate synthase [Acidobacteria bacterium AB60]